MRIYRGRVAEIIIGQAGKLATKIICSPGGVPAAGQYLAAWAAEDTTAVLSVPLFPSETSQDGFVTAPPVPESWYPGLALLLRGPLGHGFRLPAGVRRLALAALGESPARLMPLARQVMEVGGDITLYTDTPLSPIPAAIEIFPLSALPEALPWADFLAVDLPLAELPGLYARLGLSAGAKLPCSGQALVLAALPCAGLAECGACAVPVRRGWKLACEDGPVFDLEDLLG
jgi:hypothetical protein